MSQEKSVAGVSRAYRPPHLTKEQCNSLDFHPDEHKPKRAKPMKAKKRSVSKTEGYESKNDRNRDWEKVPRGRLVTD